MKYQSLVLLAVLCLFGGFAQGQGPSAPTQVQLCVSPASGATFQDTLTVPLTHPLLDSVGDTLVINYLVSIELVADLATTTNISKVHLEISESLGGTYFPQLVTSFPIDGPGNIYATYQRTGNQIKFGLSQNQIADYTYKVWVEDQQGNLSPVTQASVFHLFN